MTPKIAEMYVRKQKRERNQKEDREGDNREDVPNERRSIDAFEPESERKENRVECADKQVADNADQ